MSTSKKGFTLVELLIVIVIIGILASIVLLGVGSVQPAARDARRVAELRQMQNLLENYSRKCGFYPGRGDAATGPCGTGVFDDISIDPNPWASLEQSLVADGSLGYSIIPHDPLPRPGVTDYMYEVINGFGTSYVLAAVLEEPGSPLLRSAPGGLSGIAAPGSLISCGGGVVDGSGNPMPTYCIQF